MVAGISGRILMYCQPPEIFSGWYDAYILYSPQKVTYQVQFWFLTFVFPLYVISSWKNMHYSRLPFSILRSFLTGVWLNKLAFLWMCIIGRSCHRYHFCCNKSFVVFVMTKVCHNNKILSQQFCHKHTFVATKKIIMAAPANDTCVCVCVCKYYCQSSASKNPVPFPV